MILVDTSIWADHFRRSEQMLDDLLANGLVLSHPLVIGELALGHLVQRAAAVGALKALPAAVEARHDEVLALIERESLMGTGIGLIDAHLLLAAKLTRGARLWTRDRRLGHRAGLLGLAYELI